ncbi:hypothetical protein [Thalassoroseus pseudoceratinae]|uniref:hypothetical protein n=1 Tax=Thalassoroseus pseudoceratinae TaxID=2713176 RepID=UPI0014217305|nr:hypothetical protein [Thalassoroseus pseudoceratinae]
MFEATGERKVRFTWHEPFTYRLKLRGDIKRRLFFGFAVCGAIACALIGSYLSDPQAPGLWESVGGGVVFAFGVTVVLTFFARDRRAGKIIVREGMICRHRWYIHLFWFWTENVEWRYEELMDCDIVPGRVIGESFSLLVIWGEEDSADIIGIPQDVELKPLAEFLRDQGVKVASGREIPAAYTKKMSLWKLVPVGLILLVFAAGLTHQVVLRQIEAKRSAEIQARHEAERAKNTQANRPANPRIPPPMIPSPPARKTDAPRRANSIPVPPKREAVKSRDLAMVGGESGLVFRKASPTNQMALGFRYQLGQWAGTPAVAHLTPVFDQSEVDPKKTVFAREGYAVGGLEVVSSKYVTAVRVIFMRRTSEDALEPADTYKSEWIGNGTDATAETITSDGRRVVGIHGRRGAVLDAIGLVVAD